MKIRSHLRNDTLQSDLDRELDFHLQMLIRENLGNGMTPEGARKAALREFGNVEALKEESREHWGTLLVENLFSDFKLAFRLMAKTPSSTVLSVSALSLGIGLTVTIFSCLDNYLFKGLPFEKPHELMQVEWVPHGSGTQGSRLTLKDFFDVKSQQSSFETVVALENRTVNYQGEGLPIRSSSYWMSGDLFEMLKVKPFLGRSIERSDEDRANGQFVLTGSHQLELREAVAQSLAGRTGMLHLLPLSIAELTGAEISFESFEEYIFHGFLPRVYDQNQRPQTAYSSYYQTYVERDVRQLIQLKDASLFEKFIKLMAGRVGQVINFQSLGSDVGADAKTIKHWLSILEASFIVFKLPPYFENFGKRVIKSPKYYFMDTGLLCYLLDIEKPEQVTRDPLVGSLFENLIVLEAMKARYHRGLSSSLYFFRDSHGNEIDLLHKSGSDLQAMEIKSSSTYHSSFKKSLLHFSKRISILLKSCIVYSGEEMSFSDGVEALHFTNVENFFVSEN